jgi:hypothetical protein
MSFEEALRERVSMRVSVDSCPFRDIRPLEDDRLRNLFDHLSSELLEGPKLQVTRGGITQSEEDPVNIGR